MNNILKILLPTAGAAAGLAAAAVFALAPGKAEQGQKQPFLRRNFAHRGLHRPDRSVPENSLAAFRAAAEAGYGVELDVRLTADGEVVVFHDDGLERMCGVQGSVGEKTFAELSELCLARTEERIPKLSEVFGVFETADSPVPVIIELKTGKRNRELCEKTLALMDGYSGHVCVESFDPTIVRWFRRNAPDVLRGQLACPAKRYGDGMKKPLAFLLSRLAANFLGRPQFIAYAIGKKNLAVRLCEKMGAMKVAWTSHGLDAQADNDAVIFEFYRPPREY